MPERDEKVLMTENKPGRHRDREDDDAVERERGRGVSPGAPADLRSRVSPDFAEAAQVTETERAWIREHLGRMQEDQVILDVVRRVKAGKEATVYACTGHPSTGRAVIAAKLYRERSLRSSKNTGQYQQGRAMLDEDGKDARPRSRRLDKAIEQKSKHGRAATQMSWLMHEFTLLQTLHERGGDVPEPLEHGEQAILMEFIGDGLDAAPTLNDVSLEPAEAKRLFERVLFNIELLLELGWVHGDLSAHNILYHEGRIILIDFPQVVDCQNNHKARPIFDRDIERVAGYFSTAGHSVDAQRLSRELWEKYVTGADAPE
jgi:RIO kinase 1